MAFHYPLMDGVLPRDHLDTYTNLVHSVCLQTKIGDNIYIEVVGERRRLCGRCYNENRSYGRFFLYSNHSMFKRRDFNRRRHLYCCKCSRQILEMKGGADQCSDCIDQFLRFKLLFISQPELLVCTLAPYF